MQGLSDFVAGLQCMQRKAARVFLQSFSILVVVALGGCSGQDEAGSAQGQDNPLEGDPQAIASGFDLYELQCRVCHSDIDRGSSGPALSQIIPLSSDAELVDIIENGTSGMPAFGDSLSRDEVWALIAYLRDEAPAQ